MSQIHGIDIFSLIFYHVVKRLHDNKILIVEIYNLVQNHESWQIKSNLVYF